MVDVGTIPARDRANGVVAGVAAGIARTLEVDPTLVRLLFALLTLAGGAGILLYLAAALLMPEAAGARTSGTRTAIGLALLLLAAIAALNGLGLPGFVQAAAALAAAGVFFFWRRRQRLVGTVLLAGAAVLVLTRGGDTGADGPLLTPAAFAGGLLLVVGPWLWRTAQERDAERTRRIRSEERAEVAARVHDSVLQTLALVQREADDPKRVAQLARRQERELRGWLYPEGQLFQEDTLVAAIGNAAAEVEELHGVKVEVASARERAARRRRARRRARRPRGDGERRPLLRRRRGLRVRGGRARRDQRLRPRPRRRLRPKRSARRAPRDRRVDRGPHGTARRDGNRDDHARRRHRGRADAPEGDVVRRVVIVDDHGLFRAGVRSELGDAVEIVGEAATVAEAIPLILEADPDVVLLDVHLPDGGGQAVIAGVALERPGVRFLALSVSDAAEDVIAVVRAGARGYVTKTISGEELVEAIERVAAGDAVFSPRLAGFVLDAFGSGEPVRDAELDELTAREREVLRLIARGYRYKEIAASLHLSVKTVESHVSSVLRKLQLSSRHELTRWAAERRMI